MRRLCVGAKSTSCSCSSPLPARAISRTPSRRAGRPRTRVSTCAAACSPRAGTIRKARARPLPHPEMASCPAARGARRCGAVVLSERAANPVGRRGRPLSRVGIWGHHPILPHGDYDRLKVGLASGRSVEKGVPFRLAVDNSLAEEVVRDDLRCCNNRRTASGAAGSGSRSGSRAIRGKSCGWITEQIDPPIFVLAGLGFERPKQRRGCSDHPRGRPPGARKITQDRFLRAPGQLSLQR
jgi:hypothetical protein